MVLDVKQKEWKELILGRINPKISSFSLQMKVHSLTRLYKNGFISMDNAVKELYEMCIKYQKLYEVDLDKIFNN